jgi:small GTP-binding protein
MISKKVILTGSFGVGKTSLFNRFIYQEFNDKYLTSIGVKVNKKQVKVDDKEVSLLVWDIAGEISQDKVPSSYFLGASGIVYVMDLSRPMTFKNLESDYLFLKELMPLGVIKIVGNKRDLVTDAQIEEIQKSLPRTIDCLTSAKTGENVDQLFLDLAKSLL